LQLYSDGRSEWMEHKTKAYLEKEGGFFLISHLSFLAT